MFLLLSHGKGQKRCAVEPESEGTLTMKAVVHPITGGLVHVRVPALPVIVVVHGQGHTLLLQDDEMTIPHPHREKTHIVQNLLGVSQKNMK